MNRDTPTSQTPDPDESGPEGTKPEQPTSASALSESMAAAARRAGFSPETEGQPVSGQALLAAMGGVRGLFEAVLPGIVFLVTYTFTQALIPSLIAPVLMGLVFFVSRLMARQTVVQAVSGLVVIAFSAILALFTGKAEDFYLPGFWTNGAYGLALMVSVLVGWPLIGLAVGFMMGEGTTWRQNAAKKWVFLLVTLLWAGLFAARLAVQLPLYFSSNIEALGTAKLLMGLPLYAPLLVVSWLLVRAVYRQQDNTPSDSAAGPGKE
jgi:hypothetical protein